MAQFTDTRFLEIVQLHTDFEPSRLAAIGGGSVFATLGSNAHLEWEVNAAHHWGMQQHIEVNGIVSARWYGFPWQQHLRTSVALGTGPSYAFRDPSLEERRGREPSRLLQFLLLDITVAPPSWRNWSGFARIHHRSGVFGLVAEAGGSNFIGIGVRRHH
ncbi:hypothetical protein [Thiohalomonas denitrificans]|uniref:hypothetical protein n=1 Tax=Thiohalomonas denitrificans TaxID=415747 RepID=UPI001FDF83CF|nr:hypothetical protein [Thiohalomonas denitrificans]